MAGTAQINHSRHSQDSDNQEDHAYREKYPQNEGYDYNSHDYNYVPEPRQRTDDDWRTRQEPMEEDSYQHQSKHGKSRRMVASEASQHVIFLGLDPDFMESDVCPVSKKGEPYPDLFCLDASFFAVPRPRNRECYHYPR